MGSRKYPVELLRLKRLHRRMYAHDPERGYIAELISRAEAGYKGETTVDNYLRGLRLPGESILLRNIRLQIREEYVAQFDTLLVTERGIWIIEAKMIRGSLRLFQNPRRMERTDESGAVLTMDCPILQLENQKTGLGEWLEERGLFLPIRGVVAFATRNTWTGLPDNAPIVSVKELKSMLIKSVNQPPPPDPSFSSLNEVVNCLFAEELGPDMRSFEEMGIKHGPLKEGTICENCFASLDRKGERTYQALCIVSTRLRGTPSRVRSAITSWSSSYGSQTGNSAGLPASGVFPQAIGTPISVRGPVHVASLRCKKAFGGNGAEESETRFALVFSELIIVKCRILFYKFG